MFKSLLILNISYDYRIFPRYCIPPMMLKSVIENEVEIPAEFM